MHTTTVRFDPETWERLKVRSAELGIATADFIRIATVQRLERLPLETRLLSLEETVSLLARQVDALLRRIVRPGATIRRTRAT